MGNSSINTFSLHLSIIIGAPARPPPPGPSPSYGTRLLQFKNCDDLQDGYQLNVVTSAIQ